MPTKRYRVTDNRTGKSYLIDWDGEAPPNKNEARNYIDNLNRTSSDKTQEDSYPKLRNYYETVKSGVGRAYDAITNPLAPEMNIDTSPNSLADAQYKTEHPIASFASDAASEITNRAYSKLFRPAMSPLGGVTAMMGGSELAGIPGADVARRIGFGAMAAKGGYDAVQPVKNAWQNPSIENVSDATLAVTNPALMAVGALHPSMNKVSEETGLRTRGTVPSEETIPNLNKVFESGEDVNIPSIQESIYQNIKAKKGGTLKEGETALVPSMIKEKPKYQTVGPNEQKLIEGNVAPKYGSFNDEWADYVNSRQAAKLEGNYAGKQFNYLDQTIDSELPATVGQLNDAHPINLLQKNLQSGNFPEVRRYLDNIHQQLNDNGIETAYKADYLPQIWDNTPEEVQAALGKKLGLKPSFTFESFYKDYQEGIDAGLTPKFDKPSELLNFYTNYAKKAIADKRFFDYLKDSNQIQQQRVGSDWKPLSGDFFPKSWGDKTYYAEPKTARLISNYFTDPGNESWGEIGIKNAAELAGKTTRTVLGFHLPGTAWSMHGINTSIAHSLFGEDLNPLKAVGRLGESGYYLTRPAAAEEFLNNNPVSAINAVKDGGLAISQWNSDIGKPLISGDSLAAKGLNFLTDPKPLFQQFIPAMMLKAYEAQVAELTRSGVEYKVAARRAGQDVNNTFGVLNREMSTNPLVFDKNLNNIKRVFLLAPNWLESRLNISKETAQALMDPKNPLGKKYLSGVSNFIASYAALNILNMLSNGKPMFMNEPGKELSLNIGKDSKGKDTYINPYAGAIDFIKVPLDIAHAAIDSNFGEGTKDARSRLSEPAQFAIDLMSNTDWKGSPILGNKTKYGKEQGGLEQVGNLAEDAASHFLPISAEAGVSAVQDKISPEEAAARVLQLPMSFKSEQSSGGKRRGSYAPIGPRLP